MYAKRIARRINFCNNGITFSFSFSTEFVTAFRVVIFL